MVTSLPYPVYYVESAKDCTVLVAIDVKLFDDHRIQWFDTNKDRNMKIGKISENNDTVFEFQRDENEGGGTYRFTRMTLDVFRNNVKNKLYAKEDVSTEEELINKFQTTMHNAW